MESEQLQRAIEAILFAAGERIDIGRLAAALETDASDVEKAADDLADKYAFERRGIRILKLEKGYQMVSSGEMADYVTKALETRKPPKLSSSQLETLTIVAYYQPATKAMVEQIRGVDSAYSVAALLNKKLIEEAGRLNVPDVRFSIRRRRIFCAPSASALWKSCPPLRRSHSASRWSCPSSPQPGRTHNGLVDCAGRDIPSGNPAPGRQRPVQRGGSAAARHFWPRPADPVPPKKEGEKAETREKSGGTAEKTGRTSPKAAPAP